LLPVSPLLFPFSFRRSPSAFLFTWHDWDNRSLFPFFFFVYMGLFIAFSPRCYALRWFGLPFLFPFFFFFFSFSLLFDHRSESLHPPPFSFFSQQFPLPDLRLSISFYFLFVVCFISFTPFFSSASVPPSSFCSWRDGKPPDCLAFCFCLDLFFSSTSRPSVVYNPVLSAVTYFVRILPLLFVERPTVVFFFVDLHFSTFHFLLFKFFWGQPCLSFPLRIFRFRLHSAESVKKPLDLVRFLSCFFSTPS